MLEWMHDNTVVEHMATNFASKTLQDYENFIQCGMNDEENLNLAIVNSEDTYLGTVSLKHIDKDAKMAEFAITMRLSAMGTGASDYGMSKILEYGFNELGLEEIYWCVSSNNLRAIRFYNKKYDVTESIPTEILNNYTDEQLNDFIWYVKKRVL